MPSRRADIFLYGLFMDPDFLRAKGVTPEEIELAWLSDWSLRIGQRAVLVPEPGGRVYGMVMALTLADLDRLYAEPGVTNYRAQPVLLTLASGGVIAALCYNLTPPPAPTDRDPVYAAKLLAAGKKMGLPADYLSTLEQLSS